MDIGHPSLKLESSLHFFPSKYLHYPVHVIPANAGIQLVVQTRGFRVMVAKKTAAMPGMTKV